MALAEHHTANFEMLLKAVKAGDVALLECEMASTGETVAVVCAATRASNAVEFLPFAVLFNDDPYKLVNPPKPEGGFYSQVEIWNG